MIVPCSSANFLSDHWYLQHDGATPPMYLSNYTVASSKHHRKDKFMLTTLLKYSLADLFYFLLLQSAIIKI